MKIAVSASCPDMESTVDLRFGRCPYFIIVDTEEDEVETWENKYKDGMGGVGPQVVQALAEMDVDTVITGNLGPNASRALDSAEIDVYIADGKISDVVEKFKNGELEKLESQTVEGHFGKRGGRR
ncbi:MAG: NifB/NifX family molybdenum-iron cluster-binding protein [Candidatus Saliniplasma sp.]